MKMQSTKFVTSVTWIKRGICREKTDEPDDTLEDERVDEDEENMEEDDIDEEEDDAEEDDNIDNVEEDSCNDDIIDEKDEFDFENYDNEEDVPESARLFDGLACFESNELDPYMTVRDEEDLSDDDNTRIKPDDNVIVIANITKDSSSLDFYVYNEAEDDCFIHHSIPLVTTPICSEWVGYRPDIMGPGNYVAIGNMTPKIEFWSVDDVDSLQAEFTLGSGKKKKKTSRKEGHVDAVLDLAWNSMASNVIASGSADSTVMLWDILNGNVVATMDDFESKVQSLQWHPFESNNLLSGSCDKKVRIFDCRDPKNVAQKWLCDGEVECVLWNHFDPFYCLASTDNGIVHCFDARAKSSVWTLSAHPSTAVTGLSLSSSCPGCLVTASVDERLKVFDILNNKPSFVYEEKLNVKRIFAASASPDSPFVVCCGGDNKNHNFKVIDLAQAEPVMKRFRGRPLICVDRSTVLGSQEGSAGLEVIASTEISVVPKKKTKNKKKKNQK